MKSDFEKLLNNCQSRINDQNVDGGVKVIEISNGSVVKPDRSKINTTKSDIRPGIQGIIQQKMKKEGFSSTYNGSENDETSQDSKILFSLRDFQEKKTKETESPKVEETVDDDEDDTDELNEDDESVQDESFNGSDDIDDMDVDENLDDEDDSDIEELPTEVDIEQIKKKKPEDDLESEISKLESLQRKINDNLQKTSTSKPSETVTLRMRGRPSSPITTHQSTANTTLTPTPTAANTEKETITVDEDPISEVSVGKQKAKEEDPILVEPSTDKKDETKKESMEPAQPQPETNSTSKPVDKPKAATLPEGMFKNISISIVGGGKNGSKNVNIQNLMGSRTSSTSTSSTSSHSSRTAPASSGSTSSSSSFTAGPNISLKRQGSPSKSQPFDTKRFKSSSIVITSSRKDSPTITLDELINKTDDEEEEAPKENHAYDYNNCTHGDPLSYMCVDCTYLRWKTGYDYVKTRKEKPKKTVVENIQEAEEAVVEDVSNKSDNDSKRNSDNVSTEVPKDTSNKAADILKNVNWQQVFSFAGIGVGQEEIRTA